MPERHAAAKHGNEPTANEYEPVLSLCHAQDEASPVGEVRQVEMPEHHASTEQGGQGVGHALAGNVFANMPRALLKDGHTLAHVGSCSNIMTPLT